MARPRFIRGTQDAIPAFARRPRIPALGDDGVRSFFFFISRTPDTPGPMLHNPSLIEKGHAAPVHAGSLVEYNSSTRGRSSYRTRSE